MLRWITAFLFCACGALAQAESLPSPNTLCDQGCTEQMSRILNDFMTAIHQPVLLQEGFSGSCYHIQRGIDPNHEHHGAMIITATEDSPSFSALFSYFAKENPFQGMNLEKLVEYLKVRSPNQHPVLIQGDHEMVYLPSETANFYYWFKTTENGAWLLGLHDYKQPGYDARLFCELPVLHQ